MTDIRIGPFSTPNGLTVKKLKDLLSFLPETRHTVFGEKDCEIRICADDGISRQITEVWALDLKDGECDVLLKQAGID
ncbi:MAG: hypothetical protein EBW87_02615 [Burkholderiaceae bacterium]|nr:hypothetical protein [Burkholderiaceae bacterium]